MWAIFPSFSQEISNSVYEWGEGEGEGKPRQLLWSVWNSNREKDATKQLWQNQRNLNTFFNSSSLHERTLVTRRLIVHIIVERITKMQFALRLSQRWHGNLEHANGRGNKADVSNLRFFLVREETTTLCVSEENWSSRFFWQKGSKLKRRCHRMAIPRSVNVLYGITKLEAPDFRFVREFRNVRDARGTNTKWYDRWFSLVLGIEKARSIVMREVDNWGFIWGLNKGIWVEWE